MMEEIKKAIAAVEALNLEDGEEICSSLIEKVINDKVTFLDWRQQEIIDRLHTIGKWVTIYSKNQGEGYLDFERWQVVDRRVFHDFIIENLSACRVLGLGGAWFNFPKPLTVIAFERDNFHQDQETLRKFELARLKFVEDWLAKN